LAKKRIDVTEYELAVLQVLWREGPSTIRRITEAVYGQRSTAAYATVQKLLERLAAKKCVKRDRSSFAHTFRAVVEPADLIQQRLDALADELCSGSLSPLLMHLVQRVELTAAERAALRKLIREAAD
jgi:BlaI family penicillinase repressor